MKNFEDQLLLLMIIIFVLLLLLSISAYSCAQTPSACDLCSYSLQPGEVIRLTTLTASTPEALNQEAEALINSLDRVIRVDRSGFPKEIKIWYVDSIRKEKE